MSQQTDTKHKDVEHVDITNKKNTANVILDATLIEYGVSEKAIQTSSSQIKKKKDKIAKLLCTVV